ncbi:MAG: hypothetical protein ABIS36_19240 [Chryseolinea sp.]
MVICENLSTREHELLLKFPACISLLAANADGDFDHSEELTAIEFNHVKIYSCDPVHAEFFQDVDKNFKSAVEQLNKELPL